VGMTFFHTSCRAARPESGCLSEDRGRAAAGNRRSIMCIVNFARGMLNSLTLRAAGPLAAVVAAAAQAPAAQFDLTPGDSIQAAIDAAAASPDATSVLSLGPGVYGGGFVIESTGKK